jgi:hypothetical protein
MKSRANKSKNYNVASIQESEKHESMMREKRWTKAQRESERERDTDTKTGREREREREREWCIVYCDAQKYFYRQERVR